MMLTSSKLKTVVHDRLQFSANLCAFLYFVVVLVPQATLVHRPWLVLATFAIWFLCSLGPKMVDTIKHAAPLACLPLVVLLITLYKMYVSGSTMEMHMRFLAGPIYLSLTTFLCCFYLLHDTKSLQRIRIFSLIVLAAATSYGVYIAWAEPGVGRLLATHKDHVSAYGFSRSYLTCCGVTGYAIVYTLAMTGLILLSWIKDARSISRAVYVMYLAAVAILFAHVVLSTLTLAVFVGGVLFVAGLLLAVYFSRIRYRYTAMCGILLATFLICQLEHVRFVLDKTSRLAVGMTTQGVCEGDETGRGDRLLKSSHTFSKNVIWGCDFSDKTLREEIGDHSSLVDPLAMYGLLGYAPLLLYHFIIIRNGLRTWNRNRKGLRGIGELEAWVFYGACSFWNTTTNTVLPLALLFLQLTPPQPVGSDDDENDDDKSVGDEGVCNGD